MPKRLVVIAGPNGSGKSTFTDRFIRDKMPVVNPDAIAVQLKQDNPQLAQAEISAAKLALKERQERLSTGESFAIETTLSGKGEMRFIEQAKVDGYHVHLVFVGLGHPMQNVARVEERVLKGGHHVPAGDVVRRYHRSVANLPKAVALADRSYILANDTKSFKHLMTIKRDRPRTHDQLPEWLLVARKGFPKPRRDLER